MVNSGNSWREGYVILLGKTNYFQIALLSIYDLPMIAFDHCGLWLWMSDGRNDTLGQETISNFLELGLNMEILNVRLNMLGIVLTRGKLIWNCEVYGNIFKKKQRIIKRLEGIGNVMMREDNYRLVSLTNLLWQE